MCTPTNESIPLLCLPVSLDGEFLTCLKRPRRFFESLVESSRVGSTESVGRRAC
ncbi:hypothetical protein Mapa_012867 [Marchantia paleacea]|nr:hypothetical protein Mapa_012867 [Marchantia paleacea]